MFAAWESVPGAEGVKDCLAGAVVPETTAINMNAGDYRSLRSAKRT
jgi:hypothetical protein